MQKMFTLYTLTHSFSQERFPGRKISQKKEMSPLNPGVMKPVPSQLSLSLITGYAAALQVVRTHDGLRFDLIIN